VQLPERSACCAGIEPLRIVIDIGPEADEEVAPIVGAGIDTGRGRGDWSALRCEKGGKLDLLPEPGSRPQARQGDGHTRNDGRR
jgi:hypothetical protein